jgi:hypothetical protein
MRAHGRVRTVAAIVAAALLAAAVATELSRPAGRRTWHGHVLGVPYDFRPPTAERVRDRWWNLRSDRLFTPQVFGVGWSVNLARLVPLARRRP